VTSCAKLLIGTALLGIASISTVLPASAEALLLIEADSGKVLHADNATYPWYPASLTKLMTLYVTLQAMREKRVAPNTLITVSARAASQQPAKMGFAPSTQLTLDNALKMLMVKSANDMAVTIAEGISGTVENFAAEMNDTAHRLGMVQTSYVNPNGLPDDGQISSARDLGILARALNRDFPEYGYYWHLPGIKFGKRITRNYNKLLSRYPGADGMKTGYICASGFNLVASATRNGRQLIAVVLGAPSSKIRSEKAVQLLERGFNGEGMAWLRPSLGTVDALAPISAAPVNLKEEMCGPHRKKPASETEEESEADVASGDKGDGSPMGLRQAASKVTFASLPEMPMPPPVEVFVGAPKQPPRQASGSVAGAKPVPVTPVQTASGGKPANVKPGSAPAEWTPLTATPLAHTTAPALSTALSERPKTVPLPRPRPPIKPKPDALQQAARPPA
jgi:D-alanyl-D-alanine carboxypeptidase